MAELQGWGELVGCDLQTSRAGSIPRMSPLPRRCHLPFPKLCSSVPGTLLIKLITGCQLFFHWSAMRYNIFPPALKGFAYYWAEQHHFLGFLVYWDILSLLYLITVEVQTPQHLSVT